MKILLSNDDGVFAPGIRELRKHLKKLGEVWTVAPLEEKSTTGHSLTLHKPLRLHDMGDKVFGVSGSPADCVYLGVRQIMKKMPDIIVSGCNRGANLGQDVYYSGTVSAAREACILGIPSFAVSLVIDYKKIKRESALHFSSAGQMTVKLIRKFKDIEMPKDVLMNLNVPDLPMSKIKGTKLTKQGFRIYSGKLLCRKDHRGRDYFWIGGSLKGNRKENNSDAAACAEGFASLTPIGLDTTHHRFLGELGGSLKGL